MRFVRTRDWGLLTAFLAGGSLAWPILAPFAVGSLIAFALHKGRGLWKRPGIAGIDMPALVSAPGATTVVGTPRQFRGTVRSLVDDATVLLEAAVVRDRRGAVLLRRTEAAPFLLDREDHPGTPILITGIARFTAATLLAATSRVDDGDPRLVRMGVPNELAVVGDLEIRSIVAGGPALAVTGVIEDEAVAELAFHRDNGRIAVMRGRPGAPVLLEDRRLIGVVPQR
jgi:hypothetical protein